MSLIAAILDFTHALCTRVLASAATQGGSPFGVGAQEVVATLEKHRGAIALNVEADIASARHKLQAALATAPLVSSSLAAFELTETDVEILCVLAAPELDVATERLLAFAIDDFTRKRPDCGFLARLLGGAAQHAHTAILARLLEGAPLRRWRLVEFGSEESMMLRQVRVADAIVWMLRGVPQRDERIAQLATVRAAPASHTLVHAPQVAHAIAACFAQRGRLLLWGRAGLGRGTLVESHGAQTETPVLRVDVDQLLSEPKVAYERLAICARDAVLHHGALLLDADAVSDDTLQGLTPLMGLLTQVPIAVIIVAPKRSSAAFLRLPALAELAVADLPLAARIELWQQLLPPTEVPDQSIAETLAARYALTPASMHQAAARARGAAQARGEALSLDDLSTACRLMFGHQLGGLAELIPTGFTWRDLVLPEETLAAVQEVVRFARRRPFLLEEWGFAQKLPYGRGVSAILAGPPGTGKTMVAQLLASELGYELYRVDLSQVVNKYIGETEKNLAKIFAEAENANAVLFFDEADSLFAKRTEVKSSNDRYANLEVNYLLQRMETYNGVTLLATNIEQGIDEAFKRRVRFSVAFEMPEAPERAKLWRSMFPAATPLADDIDWTSLGKQFIMSGGYIKKSALRAAMQAADATPPRPISMTDLLAAARAEYREMGRIVAG